MTRYSWHQEQWHALDARLAQRRLPHALLLTGAQGVGKVAFAEALAAGLLCTQAEGTQACGQCQNCALVAAGTHPDKSVVSFAVNPKDGKVARELKVDQVRGIAESLTLTAQFGGYKVALVYPAERMNQNAANSLLKTLEEPSEQTLLILVSDFPSRLLPTIRSRCQELRFGLPGRAEARQWLAEQLPALDPEPLLAMAGGSPLLALRAGQQGWLELRNDFYAQLLALARHQSSAVSVAAALARAPLEQLEQRVVWGIAWAGDLIKLSVQRDAAIVNADYSEALRELSSRVDTRALYAWYDQQIQLQSLVQRPLNPQQLLEKNLLDWQALFAS